MRTAILFALVTLAITPAFAQDAQNADNVHGGDRAHPPSQSTGWVPAKHPTALRRAAHATKRGVARAAQVSAGSITDCFRSKLMAVECAAVVAVSVWDAKATTDCVHVSPNCPVANPSLGSNPGLAQTITAYAIEDIGLLVGADAARQSSPIASVMVILPPAAIHAASAWDNQRVIADLKKQGVLK